MKQRNVHSITNVLIEGDPMEPCSTDIILQKGRVDVGKPFPHDWKCMTGNAHNSLAMRVVYRYEIDDAA